MCPVFKFTVDGSFRLSSFRCNVTKTRQFCRVGSSGVNWALRRRDAEPHHKHNSHDHSFSGRSFPALRSNNVHRHQLPPITALLSQTDNILNNVATMHEISYQIISLSFLNRLLPVSVFARTRQICVLR